MSNIQRTRNILLSQTTFDQKEQHKQKWNFHFPISGVLYPLSVAQEVTPCNKKIMVCLPRGLRLDFASNLRLRSAKAADAGSGLRDTHVLVVAVIAVFTVLSSSSIIMLFNISSHHWRSRWKNWPWSLVPRSSSPLLHSSSRRFLYWTL